MSNAIAQAVKVITDAMKADSEVGGYRYTWQANIAMQFKDAWQRAAKDGGLPATPDQIHKIANEAADEFLNLLCK